MSSSLRVNTIVPSTGTNVAIGTANGTVTFTDSVNFVLGTGSSIFSPASNTLTFGTNDAERLRITSTGRIGINQASPEAMLQVDYDYANSEVGLRLRAASGSGTKTWQLSEINGNAGVFTIRNATNSQNILNIDGVNQRVGVNNTSPDHKVSVFDAGYCGLELKSNRSTATDNIGGLHFKTQSTNVAYIQSLVDGTINFRNTSSLTERVRIDSSGNMQVSTGQFTVGTTASTGLQLINDGTFGTIQSADLKIRTAATERLRITSAGLVGVNCTPLSQFQVKTGTNQNIALSSMSSEASIEAFNDAGSANVPLRIRGTDIKFFSSSTERVRITSGGYVSIGPPANANDHGLLTLSQSASAAFNALVIQQGNTGFTATDGLQIGIDAGVHAYIKQYENRDIYFTTGNPNSEKLRLYSNGKLHLGNSHIASNNLTRLHVGWNTGGTVAGESIIAGTLGNDTTAVSALLTLKNAGNRGAQGASGGSSLAKFEFNNGTAFEIDRYGRRTLPYQPAARLTIDSNGTGGGNQAQTGLTILPFNNTNRGYNTGNHFNTTNHTFTAPIAGKYLVVVSVNVIGDTILYIYTNGSAHSAGEFRSNPTGVWEHTEISSVIELSANDTVQAYSYLVTSSGGRKFNGGTNPGSVWDHMSIYFLG